MPGDAPDDADLAAARLSGAGLGGARPNTLEGKGRLRPEHENMTEVVVSSCGAGFKHEAWAGRHTLVVDEPQSLGGTDEGPSPYELLLASLGACTSMTMKLYARRKKWPLENVEIRLRHDRREVEDCADCENEERYLDFIEKQIVVSGPLTDEQVRCLGEIAEKCPVNRTLRRSIRTTQEIRLAK